MSCVAPTAAALAAPSAFGSVLREGPYRRLWFSGLCVNGARWMDLVLLGWHAFQLTDSPFMVGLAAFARAAPLMVLARSPASSPIVCTAGACAALAAVFATGRAASGR